MNAPGRVRLTALVRGRVQGVGYRMFAAEHAQALRLDGYARNLPDRRGVEVVAEGPRDTLETYLTHLRHGPGAARIEAVEASWGPAIGRLGAFDVRY